ncbi:hypothetical protein [Halobacterium hubeiense]|uniref:hypothetical protein n=1 Tax=Halobacterium hubeiense TaxID=1407499 RepID=UPI003C76AF67
MGDESQFTRRSLLATTTTALAVGVSGCLGGGTDSADESTTQQTDEPTTESTQTETTTADPAPSLSEFNYPEGSSQDGLDGQTFYQTHESTITGAGTLTVDLNADRVYSGDGQTFEDSTTETRALGSSGILVEREQGDVVETVWSPSAEDVGYVRMEQGFDTAYRIDNQGPSPNDIAVLRQVKGYLRGGSWGEATEIVEDEDGYAVVYESTGIASEQQLQRAIPAESINEFDATIQVSSEGYVNEISFEATADQGSQTLESDTTITFQSVGETTVTAPEWAATAQEQGVRFDASIAGDGTAVALEMVNGNDLPSDARLALSTAQARGTRPLPDDFAVGDQLHLALSDNGELLIGQDGVPNGASELGDFASVTIRSGSRPFQYFVEQL